MTINGKISSTQYPQQTINLKTCKVIVGQSDGARVCVTISKHNTQPLQLVVSESHAATLQVINL